MNKGASSLPPRAFQPNRDQRRKQALALTVFRTAEENPQEASEPGRLRCGRESCRRDQEDVPDSVRRR